MNNSDFDLLISSYNQYRQLLEKHSNEIEQAARRYIHKIREAHDSIPASIHKYSRWIFNTNYFIIGVDDEFNKISVECWERGIWGAEDEMLHQLSIDLKFLNEDYQDMLVEAWKNGQLELIDSENKRKFQENQKEIAFLENKLKQLKGEI